MRMFLLRLVLFVYAIGHIVTAVLFLLWPAYFLEGAGAGPPWPLSIFQFGRWPPVHVGFMQVLSMYDFAVAVALLVAMTNPVRHAGILVFAVLLWTLHGGVHLYHVIWGTSPTQYVATAVELWIGAVAILVLYPRAHPIRAQLHEAGEPSALVEDSGV